MYSVYKLTTGEYMQHWCIPFPIWNQSVLCPVLTCFLTCVQVSQEAGWVVWYSHLLKSFPQFMVKGFGIVNIADVFLELLIDDPVDVGNLISGSSAFSKSGLNIWKFTVYVLLKPGLENFEHHLASMWDECIRVRWMHSCGLGRDSEEIKVPNRKTSCF